MASCAPQKAYRVRAKPVSTKKPYEPCKGSPQSLLWPEKETPTGTPESLKDEPEPDDRGPNLQALEKRLGGALEALSVAEAQDDLTAEDRLLRLLPYLEAVWRAEYNLEDPADRRAGHLPYVPQSHRPGDPFYEVALDG